MGRETTAAEPDPRRAPPPHPRLVVAACLFFLISGFLLRALNASQPIVENYVGRQIPTAMVARNLERGSGFLHPVLGTEPFPNYFVVEPPLYQACAIALRLVSSLALADCGRLTSAIASGIAAAALGLIVIKRESFTIASWSVFVFLILPVEIRYGRAFQPDAFACALVMAGLAFLCLADRTPNTPFSTAPIERMLAVAGLGLVSVGLACRILLAFLLVPIAVRNRLTARTVAILAITLLPGLAWQAWAYGLAAAGESRAALDNQAIWLSGGGPIAWLDPAWIRGVAWAFCVRVFTPLGLILGACGLASRIREHDRLWLVWAGATLAAMALLGAKLHHEYYWLPLAPAIAVGSGRIITRSAERGWMLGGLALAIPLAALAFYQARSTYQTPPEWLGITLAGKRVAELVPPDGVVVAPEALLFYADRRGCRLEWTPSAVRRAAGEWGDQTSIATPLQLVAFYKSKGATHFADLGGGLKSSERMALHDAIRRRYKVLRDRPEVLIAELVDPETLLHAYRQPPADGP